jgi:DNA-binding Lrp family transcriptional regulator
MVQHSCFTMTTQKRPNPLTKTQLKTLQIVKENSRWVSPSYTEIAELIPTTTKFAARNIVERLIARGLLTRGAGVGRNLLLTDTGKAAIRRKK